MDYKNKDVLYNLYVTQRKSLQDVATILNCSSNTIRRYLCKYNIQIRCSNDVRELKISKEQLIDLYIVQQKTLQEIAHMFGYTSHNTIYNNLIKYGIAPRRGGAIPWHQRFLENIKINKKTGCWEWTGFKNKKGYGTLSVNHKQRGAHRLSYQFYRGPIPKGMCVCHICDNPSCVNPDHLFLGTIQDNTQDMIDKNRHYGKLSMEQVREIRAKYATNKYSMSELGLAYMVCRDTISKIIKNKRIKYKE